MAKIFDKGACSQVPSPNSIIHTLCFSTEPVRVPTLLASITTATANKDSVVMTCYTNAMFTEWLFNAESLRLRERMKLSWNNRTLTINPVRMEDAGLYQCEVSNPISSVDSAAIELHVNY